MKIGVFAPSSACSAERLNQAKQNAAALGHELVFGNDPSLYYGDNSFLFSADSKENRLSALNRLLSNPEISFLMAARGGYGAVDLLPDLQQLKDNLKNILNSRRVFISGISDVTILHSALSDMPNLSLIHGPGFVDCFCEYFSDEERRASSESLLNLVEDKWVGYNNLNLKRINGLSLKITGKMIGGNLSVLSSLLGSKYFPNLDNKILFLEETSEKPYKIHRALSQLKLSGVLSNSSGVLLGDFDKCDHPSGLGPSVEQVFLDIFNQTDINVFSGFNAGHRKLNLALPFDRKIEISSNSLVPTN